MGLSIERIEILLLIAAVVAMLARRLHVPYSIGLVLAGITLALFRFSPNIELTKQLVFTALLPPLIFEAAIQLSWRELRRDLSVILTFATLGVALSAAVAAIGMHYLARNGRGQMRQCLVCSSWPPILCRLSPRSKMLASRVAFVCW